MTIITTSRPPIFRPSYSASGGGGGGFAISGVSGSLTQNSTLTITGSGFTTKRTSPLFYDNFDSGTTGNFLASPWTTEAGYNEPYKYSTTNPLSGTKNARVTMVVGGVQGDIGGWPSWVVLGQEYTELFVEYAIYINITTAGTDTPQIKLGRMGNGTGYDPGTAPFVGVTRFNNSGSSASSSIIAYNFGSQRGSGQGDDDWYFNSDVFPLNTWIKVSMYFKGSTPGSSDGERYLKVNNNANITVSYFSGGHWASPNGSVAQSTWGGSAFQTRNSGVTGGLQYFMLPFYTRLDQGAVIDIDTVFINDTEERVLLADASTLAASNKRQIQSHSARSSTSITCSCEYGDLPGSGDLWCIVVNDGGAETSYKVR